jgi:hypothetical protein
MRKMTLVTCNIDTFYSRVSAHQILCFEVVLLQDHYKTPWLHNGQGELTTIKLKVMRVLLTTSGKVKDLAINL